MRAGSAVALIAAVLATAAPAADLLSLPAFRDRYAAAVAGATGGQTGAVGDRTFTGEWRDGPGLTINVENAYALYTARPGDLDAIIAKYVGTLTQSNTDNAPEVDQLVVIVRPTNYLRSNLAAGASLDNFVPPRPLAGDLSLFLAIDSADSIRTASPADLLRWKLDVASAWRQAIVNIRARIGTLAVGPIADATDAATAIGGASGLAPSLLAEPSSCGPAAPSGLAGQVVLVAAKDAFLVGMPRERDSMRRFWKTATAMIDAGRSLSATPITCRDGKWGAGRPQ